MTWWRVDLFEETDQKIISDLARAVAEQTVTSREVAEVVRARQGTFWVDNYQDGIYATIASASELLGEIASSTSECSRSTMDWSATAASGSEWTSATGSSFSPRTYWPEYPSRWRRCAEQVEKRYTNKYRLRARHRLAGAGRPCRTVALDRTSVRRRPSTPATCSRWYTTATRKPVVIISDAMRYEVADELGSRIRQEDRFDAALWMPGPRGAAAELHAAGDGGAVAALPAQEHSADAEDCARRRPADQQHGVPQQRFCRASAVRRSRPSGLQVSQRRGASGALQGQPGAVRLPQPDRRDRRQAPGQPNGKCSRPSMTRCATCSPIW